MSLCFVLSFSLLQKSEKQKRNSEAFPFCFHVSRSTVVDQSFTHKKPSKVLNTSVLYIKHICVLLLLGKSKSRVHVFNVLMLKTVLKWDC